MGDSELQMAMLGVSDEAGCHCVLYRLHASCEPPAASSLALPAASWRRTTADCKHARCPMPNGSNCIPQRPVGRIPVRSLPKLCESAASSEGLLCFFWPASPLHVHSRCRCPTHRCCDSGGGLLEAGMAAGFFPVHCSSHRHTWLQGGSASVGSWLWQAAREQLAGGACGCRSQPAQQQVSLTADDWQRVWEPGGGAASRTGPWLFLLCLCYMQQLVSPTPREWSLCRPTLCRPENEAADTRSLWDRLWGNNQLSCVAAALPNPPRGACCCTHIAPAPVATPGRVGHPAVSRLLHLHSHLRLLLPLMLLLQLLLLLLLLLLLPL
jgi:hypothetical protein